MSEILLEDTFTIKGRGNVVTGRVPYEIGSFLEVGMHFEQNGKKWKIRGIERFKSGPYNENHLFLIDGDEFPEMGVAYCPEVRMHNALD